MLPPNSRWLFIGSISYTLDRDVFGIRTRGGNCGAVFAEFIQVQINGFAKVPTHLLARAANAHTAAKVRDICLVAGAGLLDYYCISHFSPLCLRILELELMF